jgi:hypothetical protein
MTISQLMVRSRRVTTEEDDLCHEMRDQRKQPLMIANPLG